VQSSSHIVATNKPTPNFSYRPDALPVAEPEENLWLYCKYNVACCVVVESMADGPTEPTVFGSRLPHASPRQPRSEPAVLDNSHAAGKVAQSVNTPVTAPSVQSDPPKPTGNSFICYHHYFIIIS